MSKMLDRHSLHEVELGRRRSRGLDANEDEFSKDNGEQKTAE